MRIGFTGCREGMAEPQRDALRRLLWQLKPTEVHHGDCIGSDAEVHVIASLQLQQRPDIVIHPPSVQTYRAGMLGYRVTVLPARPYLARNRDIVDSTDVLIAAPYEATEQQTGGTWFTVRYARSKDKRVLVVLPSGEVVEETPRPAGGLFGREGR